MDSAADVGAFNTIDTIDTVIRCDVAATTTTAAAAAATAAINAAAATAAITTTTTAITTTTATHNGLVLFESNVFNNQKCHCLFLKDKRPIDAYESI